MLRKLRRLAGRCAPEGLHILLHHYRAAGAHPNVVFPRTFTDFVVRRKVCRPTDLMILTTDKLAVRDHVARKIGPEHLIPLLMHSTDPKDFRALPPPFIVKATHGSGWNIVVRTAPSEEQVEDIRRQLSRWMSRTYDVIGREPHYRYIKPGFVVEPLLLQNGQPPPDYKFMIARGRAMMILVEADRFTLHRRSIFTPDWRRLDVEFIYPPAGDIPRPSRLTEMITLAEKLGADYAWVRVDLYQQADRIYFGEITHVPEGGFLRFTPAAFDRAIGDVISGRRDVGSLNSYLAR